MFKVYSTTCKNCLFSNDRLVSPIRANEIIKECLSAKTHFICHVASMDNGQDICCRGFYNQYGEELDKIQIFKRLNLIEFIEQPDSEKLPSYIDLNL